MGERRRPVKPYVVRVRLVRPPQGHDWKGLADVLSEIGASHVVKPVRINQQPEEALACPS
jgi:hypothetical protein